MFGPLRYLVISPIDDEQLNSLGVVNNPGTYYRETISPIPGGLFDEAIFGAGASLKHQRLDEDEIVLGERAIRFGRIVLTEPINGVKSLPVLPPDLRPIIWTGTELVTSDINVHYQQILLRDGRLRRLAEIRPGSPILDTERAVLAENVAALFDNERLAAPHRDDSGRVLVSLRGLFRPDLQTAVAQLDESVGIDLKGPLPLRLHRTVATLFAMGFQVAYGA